MIKYHYFNGWLDAAAYGKNGIAGKSVCRGGKADIRCLAGMFGCGAGTLRKSSLFSHSPPNKRLQLIQAASESEVREQWL